VVDSQSRSPSRPSTGYRFSTEDDASLIKRLVKSRVLISRSILRTRDFLRGGAFSGTCVGILILPPGFPDLKNTLPNIAAGIELNVLLEKQRQGEKERSFNTFLDNYRNEISRGDRFFPNSRQLQAEVATMSQSQRGDIAFWLFTFPFISMNAETHQWLSTWARSRF